MICLPTVLHSNTLILFHAIPVSVYLRVSYWRLAIPAGTQAVVCVLWFEHKVVLVAFSSYE